MIDKEVIHTIFHILAMTIILITLGLLLDFVLQGNSFWETAFFQDGKKATVQVFFVLSIILGSISIIMLFKHYLKNKRIEIYLGTILLTNILILLGNILLSLA